MCGYFAERPCSDWEVQLSYNEDDCDLKVPHTAQVPALSVGKLISLLQKYPVDKPVLIEGESAYFYAIMVNHDGKMETVDIGKGARYA